jgi:hypothetical protein
MKKVVYVILPVILVLITCPLPAQTISGFTRYKNYDEVQSFSNALQKANPTLVNLHKIATSPGGREVTVIEIGADLKQVPAIFVGANFEGITPISTEGALYLAKMLLDSSGYISKTRWFILPLPNPDAARNYFSGVKWERTVNDLKINDDVDDQTDEDGPEDLNGDGFITRMRVEDAEGTYIVSDKDQRIMVKADPRKEERGKYKVYPEGIDNDSDGAYNEDGPGGINVGISFPHLFRPQIKESGLWPGYAPEVYGIMNFIFSHPEIAMAFTLGTSDFCMAPPRSGRPGGANLESLKIPARLASRFGADPDKTYTMAQVMEMVKSFTPMGGGGREITPDMIYSFLDLGAVVNPMEDDLRFYTEFSDKYKEYLRKKGFSTDRQAADPDKDGSFELWSYYQLGIPSFAMNLFTVPKLREEKPKTNSITVEEIEKMNADEFSALGEEKIAAFLKSQNAPERMNAARVVEMMKSGRFSPKQLVGMMKNIPQPAKAGELEEKDKNLLNYIDKNMNGIGFVKWQAYNHPVLGKVEIGGYVPFISSTPPPEQIDSLCKIQLPWLLRLSTKLADIKVLKEEVTNLGAGVYKLEIFFENCGYLPYPIAMGSRNRQPAPVVITLEGGSFDLLEGFLRTPLGEIGGNQVKKLTWMIKAEKQTEITAKVESAVFGTSVKQIKIGG